MIAALLTRSQHRTQIRAEHLRLIREPRRSSYVAYAAAARTEYDRLTDAADHVETALAASSPADAQQAREQARLILNESTASYRELRHLQAQVHVEGPMAIISKSITLLSALTEFEGAIIGTVQAQLEGLPTDAPATLMTERKRAAHKAYLQFLYGATEALGADGVSGH
ncbi:hypothetical protein ABZ400_11765 [Streptomyces sp. NPDC005897]|uniref:hypothetical protein n=1 Tax=Streptomyces sp. NPDC005897 TaxID=3157081 RepID=UPI0033C21A63